MFRERGTEFKYRAVDEQAAPRQHELPSSYNYFTEKAIRAGYMAPCLGRMHENFQNPILRREAIQRELEKEIIREEIIAAEIARRRQLEAEVRREMMLEREIALQGRGGDVFGRFSFLSGARMRFESRDLSFGQVEGRSLEERIAMSLEERFRNGARHQIGGHEVVPLQERSMEPKIEGHEMVPSQQRAVDPKISEVRLTSKAKPEANLSGAKRKSVTPPEEATNQLPLISLTKKKVKKEWSCAICQVSATSEHGLNEHIKGKKHKSKEAALRAQRNGKNFGIGTWSKRDAKPTKLGENTYNSSLEQGGKPLVQLLPSNQTGESSLQITPIKRRSPKESEVSSVEVSKNVKKSKKFKFWCEMCKVGAYSETVMEGHRKGKKHVMGLLEEAKKNRTVPTPQMGTTGISKAGELNKDLGEETSQNVM